MKLFKQLKNLLLPFENPDHPLYSAPPEEPDPAWDDLGTEFLHAPHQIEYTTSSDPNTKHRI